MNKNPDDLFFQFREYDIEIKNKIKSLDICNKKIFLYFSSFVSNKLSEIDKSKLNHLFDILNNLHLDEMKNLNIKALTYEMLVELSGKKGKGDIEKYLDQLIKDLYARK